MKNQTNSNKGKKKPSNQPVDSRIAAVRDLIFGENMQQYDQDFTEVSSQIAELKTTTDKNLADLASSLQNKLDSIQKNTEASIEKFLGDIDKKLEQLDRDKKQKRLDIAKRLERLEETKADSKKLGKALEKIALMLQG